MMDEKRTVHIKLEGVDLPRGMTLKAGSTVRIVLTGEVIGYQRGEKGDRKSKDSYMRKDRPASIEVEYKRIQISSAKSEDTRSAEEIEEDLKDKPMTGMSAKDDY